MSVDVSLPGPLDLPASLEGLRRWGDDGLDRWDGETLLRTVRVEGEAVPFAARVGGSIDRPILRASAEARRLDQVVAAIPQMFVARHAELADLARRDPVIRALDERLPGARPLLYLDLYPALVRSISAQQINLRFACTLRRRLVERYGRQHQVEGRLVYSLEAADVLAGDPAELRAMQLSQAKSRALFEAAAAVQDGRLDLESLRLAPDDEVIARITAVHGLGRWSAEWFLARTLGRPRVVAGDLGVRKAVGLAYLGGQMPSETQVRELTAHWGEAAGVAQQLLLNAFTAQILQTLTSQPPQADASAWG